MPGRRFALGMTGPCAAGPAGRLHVQGGRRRARRRHRFRAFTRARGWLDPRRVDKYGGAQGAKRVSWTSCPAAALSKAPLTSCQGANAARSATRPERESGPTGRSGYFRRAYRLRAPGLRPDQRSIEGTALPDQHVLRRDLPAFAHGSECERYEPLDHGSIYTIMSKLCISPADSLLDYGCGMGRLVVVACTKPFRSVIGVEVSPALCRIARANVRSAPNMSQTSSVEIVAADARELEVPDHVTVFWFFNPFYGAVMAKVMARIYASLRHARRRIVVVHVVPDNMSCPFVFVDGFIRR